MELKIKDIADILNVSEKTIYRWVNEKKIPVYKVNHQYRFNKEEINSWISKNKISFIQEENKGNNYTENHKILKLSDLIKNGGIFYKIEGDTIQETIKNAVELLNIPSCLTKKQLYESIIERENLSSTALGKGILIPHAKEILLNDFNSQSVSICFLENNIKYDSIDDEPIHTLFIVLSADTKQHLNVLYKIIQLCQQKEFISLLKDQKLRNEIISYIEINNL